MELVLTNQHFETLPKQIEEPINEYSGFLNSQYKNLVNESLNSASSKSIFGIRQSIKNRCYTSTCVVATALKLSVFLTIILLIFN